MGIILDLIRIVFRLGWQQWGWKKTVPVHELHAGMLSGKLAASQLARSMKLSQVTAFTRYHDVAAGVLRELMEQAEAIVEEGVGQEVELSVSDPHLRAWIEENAETLASIDGRERLQLRITQVSNLIDRDLEKLIRSAHGGKNIVRREN